MSSNDTEEFDRAATLRDGTPVRLRVARHDDEARVLAAFAKLDPQSIYTRFFSFKKELSAADLQRLHADDASHSVMLLLTLKEAGNEIVIAGGSYVARTAPDGMRMAEVAFLVEEDYQRQGIAGLLMGALTEVARAHGIDHLEAEVLAGNTAMLAVFQRCGLPLTRTRDGGVTHLTMDLAKGSG